MTVFDRNMFLLNILELHIAIVYNFVLCSLFQAIFIFSLLNHKEMLGTEYKYPEWSLYVGYAMTASSILCIPVYIVYKFAITPGGVVQVSTELKTPVEYT